MLSTRRKLVKSNGFKLFREIYPMFCQICIIHFQHHEKNVDEQKQMLKELRKTIKQKEEENRALERELEELNVSVNERQHIDDVNGKIRTVFCS